MVLYREFAHKMNNFKPRLYIHGDKILQLRDDDRDHGCSYETACNRLVASEP